MNHLQIEQRINRLEKQATINRYIMYGLFSTMIPIFLMGQVTAQNEVMNVGRVVASEYILSKDGEEQGRWGFDENDSYPELEMDTNKGRNLTLTQDGLFLETLLGVETKLTALGISMLIGDSSTYIGPSEISLNNGESETELGPVSITFNSPEGDSQLSSFHLELNGKNKNQDKGGEIFLTVDDGASIQAGNIFISSSNDDSFMVIADKNGVDSEEGTNDRLVGIILGVKQ
jgi:hypothetical protein